MTYQVEKDILFTNFIASKPKISKATIKQYHIVLKKFCNSTNNTLSEIIENCKNQQDKVTEKIINHGTDENGNQIIEKTVKKFNVNNPNSYINLYLNTHINYCKKENNKNTTINHDIIYITTFLKHYGIELPKIEKFPEDTPQWNLLSKQDINYIMADSTLTHQSLIKLMMSSGMRLSDALNLTWADIMEGTSEYHNYTTLEDFAENAPRDMICKFEFYPKKTERHQILCITFCDPETMNLLLQNLNKIINETLPRINKRKGLNLTLSKNNAVFGSQKVNFQKAPAVKSISDRFTLKNRKLKKHHINIIKEKIKNGGLAEEDYDKEVAKIPKFHAHGLRKFFSSMIAKNCGNLRICTLMEGHTSPVATDSSYIQITLDEIKEAYMSAIPDLSLENTEVKVYTSEVRKEMENKISNLENELAEKEKQVNHIEEKLSRVDDVLARLDKLEGTREVKYDD